MGGQSRDLENLTPTMQLADFKKALHSEMQEAALTLLPKYFEMLSFTEDPEVMRKGLSLLITTVGAEAEKKQDPYGNLPVVNITFSNGTMASHTTLPAIEVSAQVLDTLQPTPTMLSRNMVNSDVDFGDEDE